MHCVCVDVRVSRNKKYRRNNIHIKNLVKYLVSNQINCNDKTVSRLMIFNYRDTTIKKNPLSVLITFLLVLIGGE